MRKTKAQWLALIADFEKSGMTQVEFCAKHGIDAKYFSARKSALRHEVANEFIKITPPQFKSANGALITLTVGNVELTFSPSVDANWLARFVVALQP